jgi:hypothetical protein
MKKLALIVALVLFTASYAGCGTVPRIVIQHPKQAKVFLHPPICESRELPSIPNNGVIYIQVYVHNANELYIELNGQPIYDETGTIVYNPKRDPDLLEIIPIYIAEQREVHIVMAQARNQYGKNTVYAAFIPIPTGKGDLVSAYGCTTMY